MRRALGLILLLLTTVALAPAQFTTERFDVGVTIRQDRSVEITETIAVDFSARRRGIIREIPFRTATPDGKRVREVSYTLVRAEADRGSGFTEVPAQEREQGGNWNLRIGDPNVYVHGPVTYRIAYRVEGALTDFPNDTKLGPHTEFNWVLIHRGWPTTIRRAKITAQFPEPASNKAVARILLGERGSRAGVEIRPGQRIVGREDLLEASFNGKSSLSARAKSELSDNDSLSLILALPKGTVDPAPSGTQINRPLDPRVGTETRPVPKSESKGFNPLGLLIPLLSLPALYWLVKDRLAPKPGPLVVRFDPPEGVGPSESGVILDNRVDPRDIIAGIVSLAQKGAIRMVHTGAGPGSVVLQLLGLDRARGLSRFESELYLYLEPFGPEVSPDVLRGNFHQQYQALSQELHEEVVRRGYYSGRADNASAGPGCLLIVAIGGLVIFSLGAFGVSACAGGLVALVVGMILVSRVSNLTSQGAKVRGEVLGLREFISRANAKELNYMADRMPDQALFEMLLPYAVAFGLVSQWTHAFEGLNIEPPEWFGGMYGTDMLWTMVLIDTMGGFEHTWSDAVSYNPAADVSSFGTGDGFASGDSGFGGGFDSDSGGFSGGGDVDSGGGGGGGGDW